MNFTWFMARRLYREGEGSKRASRSAVTIATTGVALGLAVMIIAISVVLGFKQEVQKKVIGIGNHIQVLNYQSLYSSEALPIVVNDSLLSAIREISDVVHVQRYCQKAGMLKTDESFQGVVFRGIDEEYDLTFLRQNLIEGKISKPFSSQESTGRLVISQRLANQLHLGVGSKVFAYFFDNTLRARRFTVEAVYATNLSEYDARLVFCDYKTSQQLLGYEPDQASGAEVTVKGMEALQEAKNSCFDILAHEQQDHYGGYYAVRTITETYPHIFAWLDLLDVNVIVILILMVAVAGFTTISGLLIIILERTQFIGIMKALGSNNRSLRHLFIYYSTFIIGRGLILGNVLGLGLCFLQTHFGLVRLDPTTYYVSVAPVLISWPLVLLVNVLTFIISTLALILPSFVVSHIHPARSIRFE